MKNRDSSTKCAVVLAAGYGERFKPLTEFIAKPAIPFLNKPMICWIFDQLISYGIEKVFVNLHHLPNTVKRVLKSYQKKIDIFFSFEEKILGTYGLFSKFKDRLSEKFFVINSDIFLNLPFKEMDENFNQDHHALLLLKKRKKNEIYTPFSIKENEVTQIGEGDFHFCGFYIARKDFVENAQKERKLELLKILKEKAKRKLIGAFVYNKEWLDLGTPSQYLKSTKICLKKIVQRKMELSKNERLFFRNGFPLLIEQNAQISPETKIKGFVVMGKESKLFGENFVKDVVLLPNSSFHLKKNLEKAIVFKNKFLYLKMDKNRN